MALLRIDPGLILWLWILFGLVLLLLRLTVWKRITGGLDARSDRIRDDLAGARQALDEAQKTREEAKRQIEASRKEAALIIEQARFHAASMQQRLARETEAALAAERKKTSEFLEQARLEALQQVQGEIVSLCLAMTRAILSRQTGPQDEQAMISEFQARFPGALRQ